MVQIIPTINVQSQEAFISQLRDAELLCDLIQIDVADGQFTAWKNWAEPEVIKDIQTGARYEAHLMVKDVEKELARWSVVQNIQRVIIHFESFENSQQFYTLVNKLVMEANLEIGAALNPDTPIEVLEPIADKINYVMLLGVNPGTSGQQMRDSVIDKIQDLRIAYPDVNIEIDGGINETNARSVVMAGANILCMGAGIFNDKASVRENYEKFLKLTN